MTKLTDTQLIILTAAARRDDGLVPIPEAKKFGAQRSSLVRLIKDGLVLEVHVSRESPTWSKDADGQPLGLSITEAGSAAIGLASEAVGVNDRTSETQRAEIIAAVPHTRRGSKIESVAGLLSRESGASVSDLMAATGWQAHSTRAALTGLRKQGHKIEKRRAADGTTIYGISRSAPVVDAAGDRRD